MVSATASDLLASQLPLQLLLMILMAPSRDEHRCNLIMPPGTGGMRTRSDERTECGTTSLLLCLQVPTPPCLQRRRVPHYVPEPRSGAQPRSFPDMSVHDLGSAVSTNPIRLAKACKVCT